MNKLISISSDLKIYDQNILKQIKEIFIPTIFSAGKIPIILFVEESFFNKISKLPYCVEELFKHIQNTEKIFQNGQGFAKRDYCKIIISESKKRLIFICNNEIKISNNLTIKILERIIYADNLSDIKRIITLQMDFETTSNFIQLDDYVSLNKSEKENYITYLKNIQKIISNRIAKIEG